MAVKTSNQHHIGPFKAQTGEGSALRLCLPTQLQLKTVKTVEIEPESAVPAVPATVQEAEGEWAVPDVVGARQQRDHDVGAGVLRE